MGTSQAGFPMHPAGQAPLGHDKIGLADLGTGKAGLPIRVQTRLFPNWCLDMFLHRKLEDYDLDWFSIRIRLPPLYISEDHGPLKDPTLNPLFYIY
jgi:hypothetical protein